MITLMTGLPGNGKTLFALWYIKAKAEKEQREVYYHNIKDLTLPWTACDAQKWMDLPHGSIIVIDECQDVFPKKPNGAALPDYYSELAKHRHRGFDIYLITQHPSLIDNFVRQLVGQHFHSVRKFGLSRSTIYEWSATNPAPQNPSSQKAAIPLKWAYPKEVYSYYKSAEVHTVKRAVPMKLVLAVLFVVGVAGFGYYMLDSYQNRTKPKAAQTGEVVQPGAAGVAGGGVVAKFDPLQDAIRFSQMSTPRVVGLQHTAPKYDKLTEPTAVPVPAMCIQRGEACKCFSQQATPLDVQYNMCLEFARNGYFREFDPEKDRQQTQLAQVSEKVMERQPDVRPSGPYVVVMPYEVPVSRLTGAPSRQ
ncbi:MAG: zonular occludens toxin domain-containing protein [Telluria sp.]